jgi:hypothetical protein
MPRHEPLRNADVIAARVYTFAADPEDTIRVRIQRPVQQPDGRFECGAEITHNGEPSVWPMNGCDALEALLLAISMVIVHVQLIAGERRNELIWKGGRDGQLGLLELLDNLKF